MGKTDPENGQPALDDETAKLLGAYALATIKQ
jgi:hypothetical protein